MEIGESLVGAFLRQIVGCDVVLYNTYLPDGQGEIDVIGIKKDGAGNQTIHLIEVTTHILGMLYKDQDHTIEKVLKKRRVLRILQKSYSTEIGSFLKFGHLLCHRAFWKN